jgi:hypothetical protein
MTELDIHIRRLRAWCTALDLGTFTARDLGVALGSSLSVAQEHARVLALAGGLRIRFASSVTSWFRSSNTVYSVALSKTRTQPPPRWQKNAWRAVRIHKRFKVATLFRSLASDSITIGTLEVYCDALWQAGYLNLDFNNSNTNNADDALIYSLLADSGPQPPVIEARETASSSDPCSYTIDRKWVERLLISIPHLFRYPEVFCLPEERYPRLSSSQIRRSILYNISPQLNIELSESGYSIKGNKRDLDSLSTFLRTQIAISSFNAYVTDLTQWYDTYGRAPTVSKPALADDTPFPYPITYAARRKILHRQRREANGLEERARKFYLDDLGAALYGHRPGERLVDDYAPTSTTSRV